MGVQALALMLLPILLSSCIFDSSSPAPVHPGSNAGMFRMIPNDANLGDSVSANLAEGVVLPAFPAATYTMSMDASDENDPPTLRLYRLIPQGTRYSYTLDQTIDGVLTSGRWTWVFTSKNSTQTNWLTVLERNHTRWSGSVAKLKLEAQGGGASHLALNLWIVGKYFPTEEGDSSAALADALLSGFRDYYGAAGVIIDTLILRKASSHPVVGSSYPDNKVILAPGLDGVYDSLGNHLQGTAAQALDLVLVAGFSTVGMLGISPLLGLNLEAGDASVVLLSTQRKETGGTFVAVSRTDVVMTALHEVGHFFGLRHTTATSADWLASGDYSVLEDGLGDTPWCPTLESQVGALATGVRTGFWSRTWLGKQATIVTCPDTQNLMFPYAVGGTIDPLSSDQGLQLRTNLSLFPHD